MDKRPFFSIICPSFGNEPFLEQCISSVIDQTFTDYEFILINDQSPGVSTKINENNKSIYWYRSDFKNQIIPSVIKPEEQTEYIFKNLIKNDIRFKYFKNKKNLGLGPTKNVGLSLAIGKKLVILDSDDFLEKQYLEKVHNKIKNNDNNHFCGNVQVYNDGMIKDLKSSQKFLPKRNTLLSLLVFPTWSLTPINHFWDIDLIKKNKIQYVFKNKGEDTGFYIDNYLTIAEQDKIYKFEPIHEAIYNYRDFENQMTKQDGFEIELFEHTTAFVKSRLTKLKKIGYKYYILGWLFIWRFSLYKKRLETKSILKRYLYIIQAKILTIIAISLEEIFSTLSPIN